MNDVIVAGGGKIDTVAAVRRKRVILNDVITSRADDHNQEIYAMILVQGSIVIGDIIATG